MVEVEWVGEGLDEFEFEFETGEAVVESWRFGRRGGGGARFGGLSDV